jgi:hypothetical protein
LLLKTYQTTKDSRQRKIYQNSRIDIGGAPVVETITEKDSLKCKILILGCIPVQVVTEYRNNELDLVLDACERMHAHLTAAVVSNDPLFLQVIHLSLF